MAPGPGRGRGHPPGDRRHPHRDGEGTRRPADHRRSGRRPLPRAPRRGDRDVPRAHRRDPVVSRPFQVRLAVRSYELDTQGHVTTAAYLQYADHTRWKLLEAAGVDVEEMRRTGVGPVTLETTVRFVREL